MASVVLDVQKLTKVYYDPRAVADTTVVALEEVSLQVNQNEFVCVIGRSGCGKTTLLRIMAGLTAPTRGEVYLVGERVSGPCKNISIVFQNYGLLPWRTLLRNVEFGLELEGVEKEARRAKAFS